MPPSSSSSTALRRRSWWTSGPLTGIGGSNIKGVPGIGPKTATQLLQQYGDPGCLLEACEQEEAGQTLPKLRQHRDEALLAQRLVRLQHDIPLGFNLREIRYPSHRMPGVIPSTPFPKTGRTC